MQVAGVHEGGEQLVDASPGFRGRVLLLPELGRSPVREERVVPPGWDLLELAVSRVVGGEREAAGDRGVAAKLLPEEHV
jgi:hypothetical protein